MACDWSEVLAAAPRWVLVANLPYNVATPLVLELLQDVPAIDRMLVMVQREAGERLVASPGSSNFGAVSVRVDYFATLDARRPRPARRLPAAPECGVRARGARAARVAGGRPVLSDVRRNRRVAPRRLRRQAEDAPPIARRARRRVRLRGRRDRRAFAARRARHRGLGQAGRVAPVDLLRAPAKLTRSLRVVGRRDDGYHLLEAEMATLDLSDELEIEEGADGFEVVDEVAWVGEPGRDRAETQLGGLASAVVPPGPENLVIRALATTGRRARCGSSSGSRREPVSAAAPRMRRPCSGGRASSIRGSGWGWERTSRFASWAGGRWWAGSGRSSNRSVSRLSRRCW